MTFVDEILDRLGLGPDDFDPTSLDASADQALIDLLLLAMLIDGSSSEVERERIREHLGRMDWPDGASPFGYADAATARVRTALGDDHALEALLASVTERLRRDDDREFVLRLVRELAGLDGAIGEQEVDLLLALRRRFEATPGTMGAT